MRNTRRFLSNFKIVSNKGGLFSRIIANYFLLISGKQPLRTVEIALTYDCQCKCQHCSAADLSDNKKKELMMSELRSVIDQSIMLGAIHILFTGGEALLKKDKLLQLIEYARGKNCITSIDTNGLLVDKKCALALRQAGLDVICISLDSMDSGIHDSFRRYKGCFEKSIQAIKDCKGAGIDVIISTLVTKENLRNGDLLRVLEFAGSKKSSVIFCLPVLTGNWEGNNKERLNKEDYRILDGIMEHPLARLCEENNYFFKGCAAGSEKISISLYGDVMPCSFIKEKYGNIKSEKLGPILRRMRSKRHYKKINRGIRCLAAEK